MADLATEMRLAEYKSLRDEIVQSRQYLFERPLLIVTAAGVGAVQLSGQPSVVVLPLLLVIVLLLNLWFTANRLSSIARIAAYIQVVLESTTDGKWIGWEKSLRMHRIWMKKYPAKKRREMLEPYINPQAIPDAMMSYPALYWLHVAVVLLAVSASGLALIGPPNVFQILAFAMTLAVSCLFAYYCLGPHRPSKLKGLIEEQRAVWMVALDEEATVETTAPRIAVTNRSAKPEGKTLINN